MTNLLVSVVLIINASVFVIIPLIGGSIVHEYVNPEFTTDFDCPSTHLSCENEPKRRKESVLRCSCSPSCFQDGDCCLDAPISRVQQAPIGRTQCVTLRGYKAPSYYMITSCPASWSDDTIRKYCDIKTFDDGNNEIYRVPVSSVRSNATYRNLFCAICNGEREGLVSWHVQIGCSRGSKIVKIFKELLKKCVPEDAMPQHLQDLGIGRLCDTSIESQCLPRTEMQARASPLCHVHYAPVKTKAGKVYKNKFCAFCHGETYENLRCTDVKLKEEIGYAGLPFNSRPFTQFIFGFGFSFDKTTRCDADHIYVNWTRQGGPQVVDEGSCIWVGHGKNKKAVKTVEDCPAEAKVYRDYLIDADGTALIYETNATIPKNGYHILDNSSLVICLKTDSPITFQGFLFIFCSCVSLVALFMKVMVHLFVPEPKTVSSMSVAALSSALFFAQLAFLLGVHRTDLNFYFCLVIACVCHYFLIVSFCWTNVLAFDIFKSFSNLRHVVKSSKTAKKRFLRFNLYAWFTPLVFVGVSIVFDRISILGDVLKPGYGLGLCWFTNNKALLLFCGGPLALILGANVFFFIVTSIKIYKTSKEVKMIKKNACGRVEKIQFRLYIKLALIMGLTWLLAFVAGYANSEILWRIFDILYALQGTFIFVAFTDFKVRSKVARLRHSWLRLRSSTQSEQQMTPLPRETDEEVILDCEEKKPESFRDKEQYDGNGNEAKLKEIVS